MLKAGRPYVSVERAPLPRMFGSYELLEEVARGGMGIVFRARQVPVNRLVAVKVMVGGEFASPDFVKRFRTEAEAVASLDHPHIVPVYEVGEWEGQPFFSMKFVGGGTLARGLSAGNEPIGLEEGAGLMIKLARAVHYAHQRSILHRDIKPGNVLIEAGGEPLLSDFGLAKLVEKDSTLTRTMAMLGTPSYMSPEQARGEARQLTTAVDIYGLGAVFYEVLTGQPPFAAGTTMETIRHVLERNPRRPSLLRRGLDRDLETICLKCLEKDPARRYGSADAFAQDLECWLRREPIRARPVAGLERAVKWMQRRPLTSALIATTLFAVSAGFTVSIGQAVRATRAEALARERLAETVASESRALKAEQEAKRRAEAEMAARKSAQGVSIVMMNILMSENGSKRDPRTITVAEKLSTAVKHVESLRSFPEQQNDLLLALGQSYLGLGLPEEARALLTRHRDYCLARFGPDDNQTMRGNFLLATALQRVGRYDEAREMRSDLLARHQKVFGPEHESTLRMMNVAAIGYRDYGPREDGIRLLEELLRLRVKADGLDARETEDVRIALDTDYFATGAFAKAIVLREGFLTRALELHGETHPGTIEARDRLAEACLAGGRVEEALRLWGAASANNRSNRVFDIKVAGLQVWFGSVAEHAAMTRRLLQEATDTDSARIANCVAKIASIRRSSDAEVREAALRLAARAVELGGASGLLPWYQMSLGMAEYRQAHYAPAVEALRGAEDGATRLGVRHRNLIQWTARMYRAMCAFQLKRPAEAEELLSEVAAAMKPPPEDDCKVLADRADHDDLVLWLAYKEAKDLLKDEFPARTAP